MTIDKKKEGNQMILKVSGRLDTMTAPELETTIKENLEGTTALVLDFENLEYISSAGLRVVLGARKAMGADGAFSVRNLCSDVKEIFDKTHELEREPDCMIFNQFAEMGNYMWHYHVTGNAIVEAFEHMKGEKDRLFGAIFTSGSAGTMASGDRIKDVFPGAKLGVGEALQCPTLLENGFGAHRIEGIGDKHVPWIHNVKNTDLVVDIDDEDSQKVLRLFNEPVGLEYLKSVGVPEDTLDKLQLFGISGIANMLCAIKMAKYYELTEHDVVASVMTDSAVMYSSRVRELQEEDGAYTREMAAVDFHTHILGEKTDNMMELTYPVRKRVHNLKYYTWVEQQGKTSEELNALWYDQENTWDSVKADADRIDEMIREFNEDTGLLKNL